MAKILDIYKEKQNVIEQAIKNKQLPLGDLERAQELTYRIHVIESFRTYCMTAPVTDNTKTMVEHLDKVSNFIKELPAERPVKAVTDEKVTKSRETAKSTLNDALSGIWNSFARFNPTSPEQYREQIIKNINGLIPVWLQYRDTLIPIKIPAEGNK